MSLVFSGIGWAGSLGWAGSMMRAWRGSLAGAGFAMAGGLAGMPAVAADGVPLDLSYDLTLGGITVMSFTLDARTQGNRYALDFSGHTRGMLNLFGSGSVVSSSEGRVLPNGTPEPELFDSNSDGREGKRRTRIKYGPTGPATWTAEPKPGSDGEELTPVTPDMIPGTRDILTALFDFAGALERGESCSRRMAIFDGRRRFDLTFSDRGEEAVQPEGAGFYAGPARHCHLDLTRIGGYSPDPAKYMSGNDAELWLAPVLPGEPPVPVEIVFKGRLGMMHARLAFARHGEEARGAPEPSPQSAAVTMPHSDPR